MDACQLQAARERARLRGSGGAGMAGHPVPDQGLHTAADTPVVAPCLRRWGRGL